MGRTSQPRQVWEQPALLWTASFVPGHHPLEAGAFRQSLALSNRDDLESGATAGSPAPLCARPLLPFACRLVLASVATNALIARRLLASFFFKGPR
jgi:hypothetical protein